MRPTIVTFLLAVTSCLAQDAPKANFHLWNDAFGGNQGTVLYPQYGWSVPTAIGSFDGYGFVEIAPHQQFFTNHLVVFTPKSAQWFSVHTETGAVPRLSLGFSQIGPRISATAVVPKLKGPMQYLFVTALPRFIGIRPNNLLIAGATNRFKIAKGLRGSVEGYRRFFHDGPDYAEYWALIHPKRTPHFSFGAFVIDNDKKVSISFGTRISFF